MTRTSSRIRHYDVIMTYFVTKKGVKVLNGNLSPSENISVMSIIDAIPLEWRKIRQNAQHVPTSFRIRDTIYLYLDNFKITLSHVKVSSKLLRQVPLQQPLR